MKMKRTESSGDLKLETRFAIPKKNAQIVSMTSVSDVLLKVSLRGAEVSDVLLLA